MSITVRCENCGKTVRLHQFMAGRMTSCESCNQPIAVPKRAEVVTAETVSIDAGDDAGSAGQADRVDEPRGSEDRENQPPKDRRRTKQSLHQADIGPFLVRWGLILVSLIGGMVLTAKGALEWRAAATARSWPTVSGKILSSSIETHRWNSIRRRSSSQTFDPAITYTYEVNGQAYTNDRVSFLVPNRNSNAFALEMVTRFPKGANVDVYVAPGDPQNAVLHVEPSWWPWIRMAIGTGLVALGAIFYRWTRPDPDTADMQ